MKKVIIILILVVIVFFSYVSLDRLMKSEGFTTDIEEILQTDKPDEAIVRSLILKKADKRGIIIDSEEILISIVDTEEKTVAGAFVETGGMKVKTKKLTLRFPFTIRSLGLSKTYSIERSTLYTVKATIPGPEIPRE